MFKEIFNHEQIINGVNELVYNISVNTCALRIENRSPYALDIFNGAEQIDRINPYAFMILSNKNYTVKLNRNIKAETEESNAFVSFKGYDEKPQELTGSTTFTGTINVKGDMYVNGGQIDAHIVGDVNIAPGSVITAEIQGNMNLAPGTNVNATIQNAKIDTEIINQKVSTNLLIHFGTVTEIWKREPISNTWLTFAGKILANETGVYDTIFIKLKKTAVLNDGRRVNMYNKFNSVSLLFDDLTTLTTTLPTYPVGKETPDGMVYIISAKGTTAEAGNGIYYVLKEPLNSDFPASGTSPTVNDIKQIELQVEGYGYLDPNSNKAVDDTNPLSVKITNFTDFRAHLKEAGLELAYLKLLANQYNVSGFFGIDAGNSDFIGLNGLYWGDTTTGAEGLNFLKTGAPIKSTNQADYETLNALDGIVYFGGQPLFQTGSTTMNVTTAGGTATKRITFPKPFTSPPSVIPNVQTSSPNTAEATARNITSTYFDLTFYKGDTAVTTINWTATQQT